MWIIAIILFTGPNYQIASDQMIYQNKQYCEIARMELMARLQSTAPDGGVAVSKCVQIETGVDA